MKQTRWVVVVAVVFVTIMIAGTLLSSGGSGKNEPTRPALGSPAQPNAEPARVEAADARKTINDAVAKQTKERVKDLLPSGIINDRTRLVLTNAIYFKGDWASQFKKDLTREETFQVTPEVQTRAPLMHQTASSASTLRTTGTSSSSSATSGCPLIGKS